MVDINTGDDVLRVRLQNGLSMDALARQIGVTTPTLRKIERGDIVPHKYRARLVTALSCATVEPAPSDSALLLYNRIAADIAALYKMAKAQATPVKTVAAPAHIPAPAPIFLSPAEKLITERKEWDDFFDANPLMSRIYPDHLK